MFVSVWRWILNRVRKIWDDHWDELEKWREEDPDAYYAFIIEHGTIMTSNHETDM